MESLRHSSRSFAAPPPPARLMGPGHRMFHHHPENTKPRTVRVLLRTPPQRFDPSAPVPHRCSTARHSPGRPSRCPDGAGDGPANPPRPEWRPAAESPASRPARSSAWPSRPAPRRGRRRPRAACSPFSPGPWGWALYGPPQNRPERGAAGEGPFEGQPAALAPPAQQHAVEPGPGPGLGPGVHAPPAGRSARGQSGGDVAPGASGAEGEGDAGDAGAVVGGRSPTLGARRPRRQQGAHFVPPLIGHPFARHGELPQRGAPWPIPINLNEFQGY